MRSYLLATAVLCSTLTASAGTPPPPASPASSTTQLSGTIAERIDAGEYSYLRLTTPTGDRWAAVPKTELDKGTKVTIVGATLMKGFSSKTLDRKFDEIYFGELAGDAAKPAKAAPPAAPIAGKVLERIDAASYSYLRLATDKGEVWTAVPQTTVNVGTRVTVLEAAPMPGFESKTLKRKWDMIYFGKLAGAEPPPAKKMTPDQEKAATTKVMGQHQGMAAGPADATVVNVAKAPGPDARTVAEIWAQRAALKDKKVVVRGKVVKVVPEVMGKTWLHMRDGSGTAAGKDNDLTVTTGGAAAAGDVVTVTGVVHVDRDFGAGYSYPVIVEDATVSK